MTLIGLACAAAEIGCTERWLADQVRARKFPARKIARRLMFTEEDIDAILEICAVTPAVAPVQTEILGGAQSSITETTRRRLRQKRHTP
ncbi:MAG: hypothetical protein WCF69_13485 [Mycobacterium sp.]